MAPNLGDFVFPSKPRDSVGRHTCYIWETATHLSTKNNARLKNLQILVGVSSDIAIGA